MNGSFKNMTELYHKINLFLNDQNERQKFLQEYNNLSKTLHSSIRQTYL